MTDLMEEAPVAWRVCNHDINGDPWPWSYQEQEPRPGYYSEVEPLYSASALAAAEQRGREEEREKLARRYDEEAGRLEQRAAETLVVANKLVLDAAVTQCREQAAAIRRGTP